MPFDPHHEAPKPPENPQKPDGEKRMDRIEDFMEEDGLETLLRAFNRGDRHEHFSMRNERTLRIDRGNEHFDMELEMDDIFRMFRMLMGAPNDLLPAGLYDNLDEYGIDPGAEQEFLGWESTNDSGYLFFQQPQPVQCCPGGGASTIPGGSSIVARKPVIYLYPPKAIDVDVFVGVPSGSMLCEYPRRNGHMWNMHAETDGCLTDRNTGKQYPSLFWEAAMHDDLSIDPETSHCVAGADAADFLDDALVRFGLNHRERAEFITYWLPHLQSNRWNVIRFLGEEYTRLAPLTVTPVPDTVLRVFMVFAPSDVFVASVPEPLPLRPLKRNGFTVVEWGGSEVSLRARKPERADLKTVQVEHVRHV